MPQPNLGNSDRLKFQLTVSNFRSFKSTKKQEEIISDIISDYGKQLQFEVKSDLDIFPGMIEIYYKKQVSFMCQAGL